MSNDFQRCCMCGGIAVYLVEGKDITGSVVNKEFLCNKCAIINEQIRKERQNEK